jgi:hypothetical protein
VWCGTLTLKEVFLGLYNIATVKDASIAANMDFTSGSLQWNVSCIWLVHNWELEVLASFYTLLYSHRMRRDEEDKRGNSMLDHFIIFLQSKRLLLFLGRLFGIQRHLQEWISSSGRRCLGRLLLLTIL